MKGYHNVFGEFIEDPPCPYKLGNIIKYEPKCGDPDFEERGTYYGKVIYINHTHHYFRVRFTFPGGGSFITAYKWPFVKESIDSPLSGANPYGHKR